MNPLPRVSYPSDLTDDQWAVIAPMLLTHTHIGRPIDPTRVREYLDATLKRALHRLPVAAPASRLRSELVIGP